MEATQDDGPGQKVGEPSVQMKEGPHARSVREKGLLASAQARERLMQASVKIANNDGRLSADSSMSLDQALDDFDEALRVITDIARAEALMSMSNVLIQEARYQTEMRLRNRRTINYGRHMYAADRAAEMAGVARVFHHQALVSAGVVKPEATLVEALKPEAEPPSAQDG